jgi:photosystem II stability/assembly factor-like uncharacterized protein
MKHLIFITFLLALVISSQSQAQWSEENSPTTNSLYTVSVIDNKTAWIGGDGGTVLRTTDYGITWTNVGGGAIGTAPVYNIYGVNDQIALCTTSPNSGGTHVYRTTDGGTLWTEVYSNSEPGAFVDAIWMFDSTNGFFYGDPVGGYWDLYKTSDGGASWYPAPDLPQNGAEAGWNNSMYVSGTDIYFGTNNTTIYHSTDLGETWTAQTTMGVASSYSVWFNNADRGFTGGENSADMTTDGGITWNPASLPGSGMITGITSVGDNWWWYARLSYPGTIYWSTDYGTTWSLEYTSPTSAGYNYMARSRIIGPWIIAVKDGGGISSAALCVPVELTSFTANLNNGHIVLRWATATETNNQRFDIQRKSANSDFITAGSVAGNGTTTQPHNYTYTDYNAAAGNYVYRLDQVDLDGTHNYSQEVCINVANVWSLYQNFPDPFNPATKIRYQIPLQSNVMLKVYDILGHEIKTLVNENKPAGNYEVEFNASDLASGVYFYRIIATPNGGKAGDPSTGPGQVFIQTRQMMLLK